MNGGPARIEESSWEAGPPSIPDHASSSDVPESATRRRRSSVDTVPASDPFSALNAGRPDWCVDVGKALVTMTTFELWSAVERSDVAPWMRVWREGMECWTPVQELPELRWAVASAPRWEPSPEAARAEELVRLAAREAQGRASWHSSIDSMGGEAGVGAEAGVGVGVEEVLPAGHEGLRRVRRAALETEPSEVELEVAVLRAARSGSARSGSARSGSARSGSARSGGVGSATATSRATKPYSASWLELSAGEASDEVSGEVESRSITPIGALDVTPAPVATDEAPRAVRQASSGLRWLMAGSMVAAAALGFALVRSAGAGVGTGVETGVTTRSAAAAAAVGAAPAGATPVEVVVEGEGKKGSAAPAGEPVPATPAATTSASVSEPASFAEAPAAPPTARREERGQRRLPRGGRRVYGR